MALAQLACSARLAGRRAAPFRLAPTGNIRHRNACPHGGQPALPIFWRASPSDIVGTLATRLVEAHSINRDTQIRAWRAQIELLRHVLTGLPPPGICCWNIRCCGLADASMQSC